MKHCFDDKWPSSKRGGPPNNKMVAADLALKLAGTMATPCMAKGLEVKINGKFLHKNGIESELKLEMK